ncbi:MAG: hypothetical protein AB8F95_06980 [Bacteroidia bacterium]
MNASHPVIRLLTILIFIGMLIGLVAFKAGYFEPEEEVSILDIPRVHNIGLEYKEAKMDTLRQIKIENLYFDEDMMGSSKNGMPLFKYDPYEETAENPGQLYRMPDSVKKKLLMGGSKYGRVFE